MNDLIKIGIISGPVGLKGELKIISQERFQDRLFKVGNRIYINNKEYIIKTSRLFKNNYIISLEGYESINLIDDFLNQEIFIKKSDSFLKKNEYLYSELFGFKIVDNQEEIGIVKEILLNKNNAFIKCNKLIIPLIDKYLELVDLDNKIIYVKNSKELML